MEIPSNCILIIFGASGDLAKRKLIPALFSLHIQNRLPEGFAVLGIGRTPLDDTAFRERLSKQVHEFYSGAVDAEAWSAFSQRLFYLTMSPENAEDYPQLKERLAQLDAEYKVGGNYIYYLSIAPSVYGTIVTNLGKQGLQKEESCTQCWKRLIIEKPFGYDLASGQELNRKVLKVFREVQVYRIDHYLGKETVQNILVFRFSNGIFEPLWNRNFISHIEITAAEKAGVEGRGEYYDSAGVIRDMVQNHLLQVLGIVAMEPPASFQADTVRNETVKVLSALRPIRPENIESQVIRGQYVSATIEGQKVRGYRDEDKVPPYSRTETYIAMKLFIDNWRWGGVPFFIRAGKRLPTRVTEVVIHFKPTPQILFEDHDAPAQSIPNQLIIRIQPNEGILLKFGMKLPGAGFQVKTVSMDFHYANLSDTHVPEAYERLLLDCMLGDATLYARRDAVESCWEFIDPILRKDAENLESRIFSYPAGTWGPRQANDLFNGYSDGWRSPCKNLAQDGQYCEL